MARKLALAPLLVAQALATRRHAQKLPEAGGEREGSAGVDEVVRASAADGIAPLRVLIAGDSSAAGVGVDDQAQAVAGYLVRALVQAGETVSWRLRARSGLTTRAVREMLSADPPPACDVAVVISGVNDITGAVSAARATAERMAIADWLLGEGLAQHVVFAPLPPLDSFPLLPEPLRSVLGDEAHRHDAALAAWAVGRSDVTHAAFYFPLSAEVMASDGFHPGEPVYRLCGEALAGYVRKAVRRARDVEAYSGVGMTRGRPSRSMAT
ncbi:MAG: SGNH/GDSL hydrolase family protein [Pseudomonadota bacterium]|nr:SGNH/GDSL hydrolase family protein [Pseudomonadota bacterium]